MSCIKCGDNRGYVLDFHHINPEEKTMSLGEKSGSTEWSKFFAESQKCMLLCANCHREIHSGLIVIDFDRDCNSEEE